MLLITLRNAVRNITKESLRDLLVDSSQTKKQSARLKSEFAGMTDKEVSTPPRLRKGNQQEKAKKQSTSYVPGNIVLQVLGAGGNGAPVSLFLFTDHSRYLFNCGEGTQRLAHEHKIKLARMENIFFTRNTWPAIGGLPGLTLTIQDAGVRDLALYGPPYLDSVFHSMKRFVVLQNLQLTTTDCTQPGQQHFEDAVMNMKFIPLKRDGHISTESKCDDQVVIAYICKLKPKPGALNLEKCVDHNVPPGPLLGLLKNGIDVTLDNGKIIKSKDVCDPCEKPLNFIILDVPSEEFLPTLQKEEQQFLASDNSDYETTIVVHFTPPEIFENNCYQSFLQKFPKQTQHLHLNSAQNTFSGYQAAHRVQYQLNQLNPRVFPLLGEAATLNTTSDVTNGLKKSKLSAQGLSLNRYEIELENGNGNENENDNANVNITFVDLKSMTSYHLRPKKGLNRTSETILNPNEYIQEAHLLPEFPRLLDKLKSDYSTLSANTSCISSQQLPKITFLGTGSCVPNKTRNVSCILLQTLPKAFVLLDCGEGSLGQIQRFFGLKQAEEIVENLKAIYISHLHADHHIGLMNFLSKRLDFLRTKKVSKKILLFAPKQIEPWLNFYNEHITNLSEAYELIGNASLLEKSFNSEDFQVDTGIASMRTCLVRHCHHAFGVSLILKDPLNQSVAKEPVKVTYSGDTMPCQDLIDLGLNSTILIHEATMEDDLLEEAKMKKHSTLSQAVEQGQSMNAQHIILTHFSQRYAKLPRLQVNSDSEAIDSLTNVSIAFDNMQVSIEDLQHFHLMYPAMRALFAEHAEELEQRALKRELKLERKRKLMNS
uniref:Zinc phosphodiesterase ELAC protein 2 n=1 Tax=Glossina pallidipes TaxID=7398 RepID=A0A1B0A187_GLOPL